MIKTICGNPCEVFVYSGKMRLLMQLSILDVPDNAEILAKEGGILIEVERFSDGSSNVTTQMMIPVDFTDDEIQEAVNERENALYKAFGFQEEESRTTSGMWHVGHSDATWDYLMYAAEKELIQEGKTA